MEHVSHTNLCRFYEPQLEQFARSGTKTHRGIGTTFRMPRGDGRHTDWLWVCPVEAGCLIAAHDVSVDEPFELWEDAPESICLASTSASTIDSWFDDYPSCPGGALFDQENVLAFFKPGRATSGMLSPSTRYASVSVSLTHDFFTSRDIPQAYDLLASLLRDNGQTTGDLPFELRNLLRMPQQARSHRQLLMRVERSVQLLGQHLVSMQRSRDNQGARRQLLLVRRAQNLVDAELDRMVSIDELATRLHVGRTRLCTAFRQETGTSVGAWTRSLRIERAQELLAAGATVREAALRLGYSSTASFDAMFRSQTGLSPTDWRELQI